MDRIARDIAATRDLLLNTYRSEKFRGKHTLPAYLTADTYASWKAEVDRWFAAVQTLEKRLVLLLQIQNDVASDRPLPEELNP